MLKRVNTLALCTFARLSAYLMLKEIKRAATFQIVESNIRALVCLNLLNLLRKRDKMLG